MNPRIYLQVFIETWTRTLLAFKEDTKTKKSNVNWNEMDLWLNVLVMMVSHAIFILET